jgi:hypothetical protein
MKKALRKLLQVWVFILYIKRMKLFILAKQKAEEA